MLQETAVTLPFSFFYKKVQFLALRACFGVIPFSFL